VVDFKIGNTFCHRLENNNKEVYMRFEVYKERNVVADGRQ
jgi:hypothetical protein